MIVDELGRIPMSPSLATSLARASGYAEAQLHREVTLEHLLLALTEDTDAGTILAASNVDLPRVVTDVSELLGRISDHNPPDEASRLVISADLKRILEAAAAASRGRRREINGAIVLAAIVGDGRTPAAHILRTQGLTFEEAIRVLQRSLSGPPPSAAAAPAQPSAVTAPAQPSPSLQQVASPAPPQQASPASPAFPPLAASVPSPPGPLPQASLAAVEAAPTRPPPRKARDARSVASTEPPALGPAEERAPFETPPTEAPPFPAPASRPQGFDEPASHAAGSIAPSWSQPPPQLAPRAPHPGPPPSLPPSLPPALAPSLAPSLAHEHDNVPAGAGGSFARQAVENPPPLGQFTPPPVPHEQHAAAAPHGGIADAPIDDEMAAAAAYGYQQPQPEAAVGYELQPSPPMESVPMPAPPAWAHEPQPPPAMRPDYGQPPDLHAGATPVTDGAEAASWMPPPLPRASRPSMPPPLPGHEPRGARFGQEAARAPVAPRAAVTPGASYPPPYPSFREPQVPPNPIYPPWPPVDMRQSASAADELSLSEPPPPELGTTGMMPASEEPLQPHFSGHLGPSSPDQPSFAQPAPWSSGSDAIAPAQHHADPQFAGPEPVVMSSPARDGRQLAAARGASEYGAPPRGSPARDSDMRDAASLDRGRALEIGQLVENIPRTMRVAVPVVIEVRIAKADVKALSDGMAGAGQPMRHDLMVTKAMSVRLRAPEGGFYIEPTSPETQWIENTLGLMADDFASWRWTVTPRDKGRRRLQLVVAARTVGRDGLAAESALPEQVIDVRVATNYGKVARRWGGWAAAAIAGGVLQHFSGSLVAAGAKLASLLAAG